MTFYKNGDFCSYMGHWNKGLHHGYGRVRYTNGDVKSGLFENGKYMGSSWEEAGITSFDHLDMRAQEVDFERYSITIEPE